MAAVWQRLARRIKAGFPRIFPAYESKVSVNAYLNAEIVW